MTANSIIGISFPTISFTAYNSLRMLLLLGTMVLSCSIIEAQKKYEISFNTDNIKLVKNVSADTIITIGYTAWLKGLKSKPGYQVVIAVQTDQPNLPAYVMPYYEKPFNKLAEGDGILNVLALKLIRDSSATKKEIVLILRVKNGENFESPADNEGRFKLLKIIIEPAASRTGVTNAVGNNTSTNANAVQESPSTRLADTPVSDQLKDSCTISFEPLKPIIRAKSAQVYPLYLNAAKLVGKDKHADFTVEVSVDENASDISRKAYKLDFAKRTFKDLDTDDSTKNTGYLTIMEDSIANRPPSKLVLKAEVKKGTTVITKATRSIDIKGYADDSLKSYNYLAYVGTNFDLVDGPRAKNLFFATNIFLPTSRKKAVGMYLSLYGNRTMTSTDTLRNYPNPRQVRLTDTTYRVYTDKYDVTRTEVSDNLGAYVSPLFQFWRNASSSKIQLYYSPSLEFVWRRTTMNSTFSALTTTDSIDRPGIVPGTMNATAPTNASYNFNEYVFNIGFAGFMVVHESSEISVRVHCSIGRSVTYSPANALKGLSKPSQTSYSKTGDWFFCGRAWITEPSTGLTLQAEITNNLKNARPFYGVTLSKAINFKNLGKIFQPLVPKTS